MFLSLCRSSLFLFLRRPFYFSSPAFALVFFSDGIFVLFTLDTFIFSSRLNLWISEFVTSIDTYRALRYVYFIVVTISSFVCVFLGIKSARFTCHVQNLKSPPTPCRSSRSSRTLAFQSPRFEKKNADIVAVCDAGRTNSPKIVIKKNKVMVG